MIGVAFVGALAIELLGEHLGSDFVATLAEMIGTAASRNRPTAGAASMPRQGE